MDDTVQYNSRNRGWHGSTNSTGMVETSLEEVVN